MSIEETDSEDGELQPADSSRGNDRDTQDAAEVRPAGAVPLTGIALSFADTDMDDEDEPEIDFELADYDEPQSLSNVDPSTWVLRLVELLLATAILYLFL